MSRLHRGCGDQTQKTQSQGNKARVAHRDVLQKEIKTTADKKRIALLIAVPVSSKAAFNVVLWFPVHRPGSARVAMTHEG